VSKSVLLGEILDIQNGFAFDSKHFSPSAPIGLIRIRDLRNGTVTETGYAGSYDPAYLVHAGDFLIGMDGEFRCYMWKGAPALLNQRVCRLHKFRRDVDPRYVFYGINAHLERIEAETGYTTVKHLSSRTVKEIEFYLPALAEQQRIVAKLGELDADLRTLSECLDAELLRSAQVRLSVMDEIFAYRPSNETREATAIIKQRPLKQLEELLFVSIGGVWGSEPGVEDIDVRVFRSTELMREGDLNVQTAVRRSVGAGQLGSRRLQPGDLLLEKSGGGPNTPVGRVGFVRLVSGPSVCSNFMQLMRPDATKVEPRYLHYFLMWIHQTGASAAFQNNSTNIRNLRIRDYVKILVPTPSLAEQRSIVGKLDELQSACAEVSANIERRRTKAGELRQSVLAASFRGEL